MDPDSLLALRVNGADLSPDHGYPARVIMPASPGVHNTKWVTSLTFGADMNRLRAGTAPARFTCSPCSAASRWQATPRPSCCGTTPRRPLWFVGAVIGHDLLLMPLYTLADRSAMAASGTAR